MGILLYGFPADWNSRYGMYYRGYQRKDNNVGETNKALLDMSEKRLHDVIEDREKYEELSEELKTSIDILIKVYRRRNGNNVGE